MCDLTVVGTRVARRSRPVFGARFVPPKLLSSNEFSAVLDRSFDSYTNRSCVLREASRPLCMGSQMAYADQPEG